jgi:twitching motility protein PilT
LNDILSFARAQNASDVHICANVRISLRRYGFMKAVSEEIIPGERIGVMLKETLPPERWAQVESEGDVEFVYVLPGAGRYRMTIVRQRAGWDITARIVDKRIRTLDEVRMPPASAGLTKWAQGLVLVAGPAGCGKTSTLAILIEMINQTRDEHIITIENPIEVVYTPAKCQISQRELGVHTLSFSNALRAALREDPDIIVVSELRDLETVQLAVTAAETGHLVFATMTTNDASQTVTSLIGSFPPDEQPIVRNMVAESLRGVICQQLVPSADGEGVVPAYEVLVTTAAAASMIKSGRTRQLNNVIATGKNEGMMLMDNSLQDLVRQKLITGEEAYRRAVNPNQFAAYAPQGEAR